MGGQPAGQCKQQMKSIQLTQLAQKSYDQENVRLGSYSIRKASSENPGLLFAIRLMNIPKRSGQKDVTFRLLGWKILNYCDVIKVSKTK